MKNIIFIVVALSVLVMGALLFERIQEKNEDTTWGIVFLKIIIALALMIIYGIVLRKVADIFNIK